ncbi:hypothetical protein J6590_070404 [Homalodisca vitripennis]|nr:hypothetical protein J6590_070404 [Homalodisca vitripennis]
MFQQTIRSVDTIQRNKRACAEHERKQHLDKCNAIRAARECYLVLARQPSRRQAVCGDLLGKVGGTSLQYLLFMDC